MKSLNIALAAAAALTLGTLETRAADAIALVGDATLIRIDLATGKAGKPVAVSGAGRLLGIDVRPANKLLYGVAADGAIVTIDPASGKASKVAQLDTMLPGGPSSAIVDFNPAADKLRFMGTDGTNLRVDPDTGKVVKDGSLAFEKGDKNEGQKPAVVAAAYSNSIGKPQATAMYDIDKGLGALIQQVKPNDGLLKMIGALGTPKAQAMALDIQSTAEGTNTAWLTADNTIFKVALDTGKATLVSKAAGFEGTIRDIAVLQ